jgi:hypothetical protein
MTRGATVHILPLTVSLELLAGRPHSKTKGSSLFLQYSNSKSPRCLRLLLTPETSAVVAEAAGETRYQRWLSGPAPRQRSVLVGIASPRRYMDRQLIETTRGYIVYLNLGLRSPISATSCSVFPSIFQSCFPSSLRLFIVR